MEIAEDWHTLLQRQAQTISRDLSKHEVNIATVALTSAVKGVSSDGFITIVQPTARAGATFHDLATVRLSVDEKQVEKRSFSYHMLIG